MRALVIAIIFTLAIVIGWYFTFNSVEDSTAQFINSLSELGKSVEARQWEVANTKFLEIEQKWVEIRSSWIIILDHHEVDNIDLTMAKTSEYIKSENHGLSLGEIESLKKLFSIVKENEALTLSNIF